MLRLALLLMLLTLFVSCVDHHERFSNESLSKVMQTSDGGFLLAGTQQWIENSSGFHWSMYRYAVLPSGGEPYRLYLAYVDNQGRPRWERAFEYLDESAAVAVCEHANGFAVAVRKPPGGNLPSVLVLNVDRSGNETGRREYGDSLYDTAVCATSDGGFAIAGFSSAYGTPLHFLRVDSAGALVTQASYHLSVNTMSYSCCIVQSTDQGFVILDGDALLKVNAQGDSLWQFTPVMGGVLWGMASTPDGGTALAFNYQNGSSNSNTHLVMVNALGQSVWSTDVRASDNRTNQAFIACADGGFALSGFIYSEDRQMCTIPLLRLGATGQMMYEQSFSVTHFSQAAALCQTRDGGFLLGGLAALWHGVDDGNDALILRTDPSGTLLWQYSYGQ